MAGFSRRRMRRRCWRMSAVLPLVLTAGHVCAQESKPGGPVAKTEASGPAILRELVPGNGLELAIAELRLRERQVLIREVLVYQADGGALYLPFGELMAALDFRLDASAGGEVSGWFLRESQRFAVDPGSRRVRVADREFALEDGDLVQIEGVLHVASAALDRWFALGTAWDQGQQVFSLAPPYLLAAEETAMRQRGGVGRGGADTINTTGFVPLAAPWRAAGWPLVNANLSVAHNTAGGGVVAQGTLLAEGDLLWATGRLALSGDSQGRFDARLTLGRQDPQARLLGPLAASLIEVGDIGLPSNPLLQRNNFGVGVRVAREPIEATGEFDAIDLIGDAPPGWQAELFRDSELLSFQTIASDGRYVFPQVPIAFGANRFRIQLYGPSGERQTIDRTVDIAGNLTRPGELRYSFTALQQGYSLFGADPIAGLRQNGPLPDLTDGTASDVPLGGFPLRATYLEARSAYGISRNLGVSGFASLRKPEGSAPATAYFGLGTVTRFADVLFAFDGLLQQDGASAARVALATNLGRASLSASHDAFSRTFIGEDTSLERGGVSQRSQLAMDTRLGDVGLGIIATQLGRRDGGRDRAVALRTSANIAGFSLAHSLAWRDLRGATASSANKRIDGQFSLSGGIGPVRLRAGFDYELEPQVITRRVRGEASYRLADWFVALSADRDLANGGGQWVLAASRNWNGIQIGADLRHDDRRGDWQGLLTLAFSMDRDPLGQSLRFGREARSQLGTLLVGGFVDANANGVRDADEEPLDGLQVRIDPRGRVRSGDMIIAEELPTERSIAVEPVLDGIDNPYLVPLMPGRIVTTRSAAPVKVEFAFVEGGELEATLVGQSAAGSTGQLLRCLDNTLIMQERAAFDGKVFFAGLVPGCYILSWGDAQKRVTIEAGDVLRTDLQVSPDKE